MISTILTYLLYALGAVTAYEIVRALVLGRLRRRLYRSVSEYMDENRTRLDRNKFMHKIAVKQDLLNDHDIHEAIIDHARDKGLKIRQVQAQVEEYIEEIVPFFNLLSYYKMGYWVANSVLNLIYEVVIDRENAAKLEKIPKDSVVVFIMNHRSNIDYILVAYMLARQISLSYAVGEWARVWPLEYIFKSFGAYFIRRRYRERLYHLVLEKYIQLISLQGVTQGIFIEGGLSRDGRFRPAKIGILDYIIGITRNPKFQRELVFVPAAINYDHVLEDRVLVDEWKKGKEKSGLGENIASLVRLAVKGPLLAVINTGRWLTGRLKRHGYASVSFGEPVFLSKFLEEQKTDIFTLDRKKRLEKVQAFADSLLVEISRAIPVTPVCITSYALLSLNENVVGRDALVREVERLRRIIKRKNGRIVLGKAFETSRALADRLEDEKETRTKELVSFEEDLLASDEAAQTVKVALEIMKRRTLVAVKRGTVRPVPSKRPVVEYYANSLKNLLET
jgi:glycerol-3-phosphate O-acyltransferase